MRKAFLVSSLALVAVLTLGFGAKALTLSPPTVEISAAPGESAPIVAKLFNETKEALTLQPTAAAFSSKNENGQPDFFDDKTGLDLQNWITLPGIVTLAPQETKSIVLMVSVPKTADPGGHYAAIFWGTTTPQIENSGAGIEGRIAMLVLVNVSGN